MNNYKFLMDLLAMSDSGAYHLMKERMHHSHVCQEQKGEYGFFIPKGDALPLLLVAHVDTVRRGMEPVALQKKNGIIRNRLGVLGGDDRAGMYIISRLLEALPFKPYVLLTFGEESGGIGARSFVESGLLDSHLPYINLFVEYDRRGVNEFVSYCEIPLELADMVEAMGFSQGYGSFSDVDILTRQYKVAHINMSAGYFNEHTSMEYVSLPGVEFIIASSLNLLPQIQKQYMEAPKRKSYVSKYGNLFGTSKGKKKKGKKTGYGIYDGTPPRQSFGDVAAGEGLFNDLIYCPDCGSTNIYEPDMGVGEMYCVDCGLEFLDFFDQDLEVLDEKMYWDAVYSGKIK
jgi:hypothetical protein